MYPDSQGESLGTIQALFVPGCSLSDEDRETVRGKRCGSGYPPEDW